MLSYHIIVLSVVGSVWSLSFHRSPDVWRKFARWVRLAAKKKARLSATLERAGRLFPGCGVRVPGHRTARDDAVALVDGKPGAVRTALKATVNQAASPVLNTMNYAFKPAQD